LKLRWLKRLGYGGRKHASCRPLCTRITRLGARLDGGGLVFQTEEQVFESVLRAKGIAPVRPLAAYREEVRANEPLRAAFERALRAGRPVKDASWEARVERLAGVVAVYYAVLREVAPQCVVETGTAAGGYTAFVLAALEANGKGRLVSIDIPPVAGKLTMDELTLSDSEVGYLVPPEYRGRWEYKKGDAKVLLPRVLLDETVDVFIHDSLHTRTHTWLEYSLARALMAEGALILSDDILWNDAFPSFLRAHGLEGHASFANPNNGVCVNRFDAFERNAGLGVWKGE
jgi:predicted O-methyltransferase YrrM